MESVGGESSTQIPPRKRREGEAKQRDRKIAFMQGSREATGVLLSVPEVGTLWCLIDPCSNS